MAQSPQSLERIIAADATLAGWQARRAREEALTALVRRHLPRQLGDRVRAAQLESGEVELRVAAGAVAAALRQRGPDLMAALLLDGWQCAGIRVRVQVAASAPIEPKTPRKPIDKMDLAPLTGLAKSLPAGPLKSALTRFLRRA